MLTYPFITTHLEKLRWLLAYFAADCELSDSRTKDLARTFMEGVVSYSKLTEEQVIEKIKDWWQNNGMEQELFLDQCKMHDIEKNIGIKIWIEAGGDEV